MNPPNNHNSFYGDPNIDSSPFSPYSPPFPDARRNMSPYQSSTPKYGSPKHGSFQQDLNVPLNLSRRSSESYDHHHHHQGFKNKFKMNRSHSHSFQSNSSDSSSRQSFSPSFHYRNQNKVFLNNRGRYSPYSHSSSGSFVKSPEHEKYPVINEKSSFHLYRNDSNLFKNTPNRPLCKVGIGRGIRNIRNSSSSSSFNIEEYCSPEMLEDPWAHLLPKSDSISSSVPAE